MGVVGGLLGALFNSLNVSLARYRLKYLHRRRRIWQYVPLATFTSENRVIGPIMLYLCKIRVIEAILIVIVTTASVFIVATFLGTCVRENTLTDTSDCPGFVSKLRLSTRSC